MARDCRVDPMRNILAIVALALLTTCPALAADITMHASAIDTALRTELFKNEGRYVLSGNPRTCAYAYLEKPATTLRDGRMLLRMYFAAKAAIQQGSNCMGRGEEFWLAVSGRPFFKGDNLSIDDIRLEEGKEAYRPMLEQFLSSYVLNAINFNVRQELLKILTNAKTAYQVSIPRLDLQKAIAENNMLRVNFDFSLEAR